MTTVIEGASGQRVLISARACPSDQLDGHLYNCGTDGDVWEAIVYVRLVCFRRTKYLPHVPHFDSAQLSTRHRLSLRVLCAHNVCFQGLITED